jgi:hypothetical protein
MLTATMNKTVARDAATPMRTRRGVRNVAVEAVWLVIDWWLVIGWPFEGSVDKDNGASLATPDRREI